MKVNIIGNGSIGAKYMSASAIIDNHILIDCPNGITKHLKSLGYAINEIDTIFITHLHGDHFMDLPLFIADKYFSHSKENVKVVCPKETYNKVKQLFEVCFPGDFDKMISQVDFEFFEYDSENQISVNDINAKIKLVEHGNLKPAFGYIMDINGKKVGFSGDSGMCSSIDEIILESELIVIDMSFEGEGNQAHMGFVDIKNLCSKYKDKKFVATHMHDNTRETAQKEIIENLIIPSINTEIVL